jgi:hypothetical protein
MRALPLRTTLPAALLACLLAASGCGAKDDSPSEASVGDSPAAQSSDPSSPATSPSTAAATPTKAAPASLGDRLLPTEQVPGLNATWHWQDGETGPATTDPFGACAKVDLTSIGATEVVERGYYPPDDSDDNAAEQVAEFPDANTAGRAWAVLGSWHDRCAQAVPDATDVKVGSFQTVPVTTGKARWYLLSWTPTGEETGRFEGFGMVLDGTRVAVLRIDHSGQDHSYPPGQDPMVGMVKAAAGLLR